MVKNLFSTSETSSVMLYEWKDVKSPRAVIQLAHGMAEHVARYDSFAKFLNGSGYIVVANDQRGHGLTSTEASLGYDVGDMWSNNISDQLAISNHISEKYKLPIIMMGHSYGSFLTQRLMQINKVPVAFILSGSCLMTSPVVPLGKMIANHMCKNKGPNFKAQLLADMSFKPYDKHFNEGANAWLSRDPNEVKLYNDDVYCGFTCSANFYRSFFAGLQSIYKKDALSCIDITKPVYIFSGDSDPVGNYGKGVVALSKLYTNKLKMQNITLKLYPQGRHEMLNETNKNDVYLDVLSFCESIIKPKA